MPSATDLRVACKLQASTLFLYLYFAVFDKKASIDGHENGDLENSIEIEETVSELSQSTKSLA